MPATADRGKVANALGVIVAQHATEALHVWFVELPAYVGFDALTGMGLLSASAEELLGVGEADGEFGVEGVGDSVEGGEAGGDSAAFESGDG